MCSFTDMGFRFHQLYIWSTENHLSNGFTFLHFFAVIWMCAAVSKSRADFKQVTCQKIKVVASH